MIEFLLFIIAFIIGAMAGIIYCIYTVNKMMQEDEKFQKIQKRRKELKIWEAI